MNVFRFQWDKGNYPKNLTARGLDKAIVESVFQDEQAVLVNNTKPEDSEKSWRITGKSNMGIIITVVFTYRSVNTYEYIRPITAWPASRQERRVYAERQAL